MELIFIISAFVLAAPVCLLSKKRIVIEVVSALSSFVALAGSVISAFKASALNVYAPFPFFSIDGLGAIIMLIIGSVGFATAIYSIQYLRKETKKSIIGFTRVKQYFVLLNLFLLAMFLAITADSPIFAWISIEATTLSTAFLISFYNKPGTIEAAWKYLIINSVGLLLGFFGTILYFTSVDSGGGFVSWQTLLLNIGNLDPLIAKIAFVFVLIGYGTKVGLAPMHTWLPDAHSKAPAPISALLSGVLLNVAFVVVLRFKIITDAAVGQSFSQGLLIVFGLLSIIIASLLILNQRSYKRLLAYSSIENMGIISLGFGFGGLGIFAAILHMIYHSFIKSSLFFSAGTVLLKYSSTKIANIKGMLTALPVTSILFALGLLAISGIPPFGIFFTKFYILAEGIKTHPVAGFTAIFFMSLVFIGFLKHASGMIFGEKPETCEAGESSVWLIAPTILFLLAVIVLSFYLPPFLSALINNAVTQY
ncbi:MAG: hydrogenase 4 subunit F [Candidatus Paceibacterota bacterium]|jgi:hydrogenase-4 component F